MEKLSTEFDVAKNLFSVVIWSAKESLSKILKTGFTTSLDLFQIATAKILEGESNNFLLDYSNFMQYKSMVFATAGHACSITFPKNSLICDSFTLGLDNLYKI